MYNHVMKYFPLFLDISEKKFLIIGGGKIAKEKLEKLLDWTENITVISKEFSLEMLNLIKTNNLTYIQKPYFKEVLRDFDIVISAVDDKRLQKQIHQDKQEFNILLNSVDNKDYCDFIFASYIKEGNLTVAVSTNGVSPAFAKELKHYIKKLLPKQTKEFLHELKNDRNNLPKGRKRMEFLSKKVKNFFSQTT